jgi:hypothetical protein
MSVTRPKEKRPVGRLKLILYRFET